MAVEQRHAEMAFQRLDFLTDRTRANAELFGGAQETLMPCGGLERPYPVQRWQRSRQVAALSMTENF